MVNRGACAEANRNVFRINKDVPCPQNDVYTHELGHVLGLRNTTMVMCGPRNGNAGSIMWVGRPRRPRAITSQTCGDVRRARGLPNPNPGGGGGPNPGGTNPGGGTDPGPGGGSDQCVDHPNTPGCGSSMTCDYFPNSDGGYTLIEGSDEDCPAEPDF